MSEKQRKTPVTQESLGTALEQLNEAVGETLEIMAVGPTFRPALARRTTSGHLQNVFMASNRRQLFDFMSGGLVLLALVKTQRRQEGAH